MRAACGPGGIEHRLDAAYVHHRCPVCRGSCGVPCAYSRGFVVRHVVVAARRRVLRHLPAERLRRRRRAARPDRRELAAERRHAVRPALDDRGVDLIPARTRRSTCRPSAAARCRRRPGRGSRCSCTREQALAFAHAVGVVLVWAPHRGWSASASPGRRSVDVHRVGLAPLRPGAGGIRASRARSRAHGAASADRQDDEKVCGHRSSSRCTAAGTLSTRGTSYVVEEPVDVGSAAHDEVVELLAQPVVAPAHAHRDVEGERKRRRSASAGNGRELERRCLARAK